ALTSSCRAQLTADLATLAAHGCGQSPCPLCATVLARQTKSSNEGGQVAHDSGQAGRWRSARPNAISIRLDARRADDASPFRKLALDQRRNLVRGRREWFKAEPNQPRLHVRQCGGAGDLVVKQRNDIPWHSGRHQNQDRGITFHVCKT